MKRNQGFTLIETMIAVGIGAIVIAAISSIVMPILKLRNQIDTNSGLYMNTMFVRDCISSDVAWLNTVASNAAMSCLGPQNVSALTQCTTMTTPASISLKSANGQSCISNYDTLNTSTTGFGSNGKPCPAGSTFPSAACPYRFNVFYQAICPYGAPTCFNPIVTVTGSMAYYSAKPPYNLDKFNVSVLRGQADQARYFSIVEMAQPGNGGGTCSTSGYSARFVSTAVFNPTTVPSLPATVITDPGGYVVSDNGGIIKLLPGTYDCQISVPGYMVGGFQAQLADATQTPILYGTSEFSPPFWGYVQTRSEISGVFTVSSANSSVQVIQYCQTQPIDANQRWNSMGVPAGNAVSAAQETFAVMNCSVLTQTVN